MEAALRNVGGRVRFEPVDGQASQSAEEVNVGQSIQVKGRGTIVVDVAVRGRRTGVVEAFPVVGHAAAHQPLELSYAPSPSYTGGGLQALADGRRGSADFRDGPAGGAGKT